MGPLPGLSRLQSVTGARDKEKTGWAHCEVPCVLVGPVVRLGDGPRGQMAAESARAAGQVGWSGAVITEVRDPAAPTPAP